MKSKHQLRTPGAGKQFQFLKRNLQVIHSDNYLFFHLIIHYPDHGHRVTFINIDTGKTCNYHSRQIATDVLHFENYMLTGLKPL